jgi:hypothetical protein
VRYCSQEKSSFPDSEFSWSAELKGWVHTPTGGAAHRSDYQMPAGTEVGLPTIAEVQAPTEED